MSDLISRELAINSIYDGTNMDIYTSEVKKTLEELPSADIIEHARTIKEYCERFPECEGCRFYNGLPFRCTFGICPQEWKLPEGEKK